MPNYYSCFVSIKAILRSMTYRMLYTDICLCGKDRFAHLHVEVHAVLCIHQNKNLHLPSNRSIICLKKFMEWRASFFGKCACGCKMKNKKWTICLILLTLLLLAYSIPEADASFENVASAGEAQQEQDTLADCFNENGNDRSDVMTDVIIPVGLEFLGAFLGILTALAVNRYIEGQQYKELNRSLYQELQKVLTDLSDHDRKEFYRYLTPAWDIYLASGQLALLASGKIRKEYLEIYSKIQYAQELEQEYIHSKLMATNENGSLTKDDFKKIYIQAINKARNREASEIMQLIEKLPKESDNAGRRNRTK